MSDNSNLFFKFLFISNTILIWFAAHAYPASVNSLNMQSPLAEAKAVLASALQL